MDLIAEWREMLRHVWGVQLIAVAGPLGCLEPCYICIANTGN